MTLLGQLGRDLAELVFPRYCLGCDTVAGVDCEGLCPECLTELKQHFAQGYCPRCAATVGPYGATDGRCPACRGWFWPVTAIARVGAHHGRLRRMLLACKYADRHDLLGFLGRRLNQELERTAWFDRVEVFVPVPTHWRRHLDGRPYLATVLSREVAGQALRPHLELLRRIRSGPSQIGLSRTRRLENVRGAFRVRPGVKLERAVVCLVDDVTTSGATLLECARMLRRSGAAEVFAAVVAKSSSIRSA